MLSSSYPVRPLAALEDAAASILWQERTVTDDMLVRTLHDAGRRDHTPEHPVEMPAGRMIAVCVDRAGSEPRAINVLRRTGAREVGRAQGQWRDGGWRDFDPRSPLAAV